MKGPDDRHDLERRAEELEREIERVQNVAKDTEARLAEHLTNDEMRDVRRRGAIEEAAAFFTSDDRWDPCGPDDPRLPKFLIDYDYPDDPEFVATVRARMRELGRDRGFYP